MKRETRERVPVAASAGGLAASVVPHARAMDRMYGWQRPIYNLTRRYYLIGRDRLIDRLDVPPGAAVLEIGCGTARNLVTIGRRYPEARLIGLDISQVMLDQAGLALRRAGMGYRARLVKADAAGFDGRRLFHPTPIERIVMSYALSMIPNWTEALARAIALLAPGGKLMIVDFGDGAGLWPPLRAILKRWLRAFSVTPREGLPATAARLSAERGYRCSVSTLAGGYAQIIIIERQE